MKSFSFNPISNSNSSVLILGTMPGIKSLELQQYYGHPYNNFWKFITKLLQKELSDDYEKRKSILLENGIALWDVLQFCDRIGSLDSAIKNEVPNDIEAFLKEHPAIKTIAFNGQKAAALFKKHITLEKTYEFIILPSSSPANAGKTFELKLNEWKKITSSLITHV